MINLNEINIDYCPWENSFSCEEEEKWSGIYCLLKTDKNNSKNNRYYFGSTNNLKERFKNHFNALKGNYHSNTFIQNSFNKNNNFKFIIVESYKEISRQNLFKIEQFYLDCFWDNKKNCYNIEKKVILNYSNWVHSKTTKSLMSKNRTGENNSMFGKKHTEKTKELIKNLLLGKLIGDKNGMFGKKHTNETKELISLNTVGKKRSDEVRKQMSERISGEKHHFFGKPCDEERKQKISESNIIFIQLTKEYLIENYINQNKTQAKISEEIGCSKALICLYCKKFTIARKKRQN